MKAWLRVPLIYLLFAATWIAVSDHVAALFFPDQFETISIYKGWVFVVLTTALLLALLRGEAHKRDGVETRLRALIANDPLTGLCNRVSFSDALERAIAQAQRDRGQVGVLFLDLDGFKTINDCYGHHVGDALLREVGLRITDITRSADCAGRFGGDEFIVLLRAGRHGTEVLARRLLEGLREPYRLPNGVTVGLTASIGYAIFPEDGQEGGQLLRAADQAMYRVKSGEKNAIAAAGGERPGRNAL